MTRGVTLTKLLNDLRAESRTSLNAAHNASNRDPQVIALQRKQEWFWQDFDWPHMRVERYIELAAGQYVYDPPSDLAVERIESVSVRQDGEYVPLDPGIDAEHFALYDTELDARAWPVQRWRLTENDEIEVWPIPDTNYDSTTLEGKLKIVGIRNLNPLVEGGDTADLDDRLLILHCAAEALAAAGAKDAQLKLDSATRLYTKLRGGLTKRRKFPLFATPDNTRRRRQTVTYRAPS